MTRKEILYLIFFSFFGGTGFISFVLNPTWLSAIIAIGPWGMVWAFAYEQWSQNIQDW